MTGKKIYVIHEYGAPEHYLGLEQFAELNGSTIKYLEFSVIRKLAKALIRKKSAKALIAALENIYLLISWFIFPSALKNSIVVLGIAPLDLRVVALSRVVKHANVIYHTSWNIWDGSKFPYGNGISRKWRSKFWRKFLVERCRAFATVTPACMVQLQNYIAPKQKRMMVVYHSYMDCFRPGASSLRTPIRLVYAGRLVENKGIWKILELARLLPNNRFSIVGVGGLLELIQEKKTANVTLHGFIENKSELAAIFQEADVFLLPSIRNSTWEELFGIALIEAMACGCVPITTDHVGPTLILGNTVLEGNMLAERTYVNDAEKLIKDMELEPNLFRTNREAAISISKRFSQRDIAMRWKEVIGE